MFQEYVARQTRGFKVQACDVDCKAMEICQMRAARSEDNCGTLTPGVNFKKRGLEEKREVGVVNKGVCEGSRFKPILASIVGEQGLLEGGYERALIRSKL